MSTDLNVPELAVTNTNENMSPPDHPKQRISIVSETGGRLSPHQHFSRKTSVASDHSADGPVRRKSILHNSAHNDNHLNHHINHAYHSTEDDKHWNGDININQDRFRSVSRSNSFYSDKGKQPDDDALANSWWFLLCQKCRQKETTNSWEPPHWQKVCPYPFCPSYRQFARLVALILIGLLLWGIVFTIIGDSAAPGGQLFGLAVLCICANFGGWIATIFRFPALTGMLAVGILFQNVGLVEISGDYNEVCAILRKIALVIILIRAGLDLDPAAFKRLYITILKIGLVPWIVECCVVAVFMNLLLGLPWVWGFLLGSIIAAVSPAVIVPCLFRLRSKGYGIAKGIPTIIIAISGIDDAASVAIFGIIHSIMFSNDSLVFNIIQGPLSVIMGIGFGALWGLLSKFVPEKDDPFVVPLRILMLFGGGLISVFGSDLIGFGGAGPLGVVGAAFVSAYFWNKQGWDIEDNPATTAFEIFWMIFEPILFGITGTAVKFDEMDGQRVSYTVGIIAAAGVIRILVTMVVTIGGKLNLKEKIFVSLALMAKATVQAALAPVALDSVRGSGDETELDYAKLVLEAGILSICMMAPLGAVIIMATGPRLLTKTTSPPSIPEWRRRSHRPSIRDISIIDEEEELENSNQDEEASQKGSARHTDLEISEVSKKDTVESKVGKVENDNLDNNENRS